MLPTYPIQRHPDKIIDCILNLLNAVRLLWRLAIDSFCGQQLFRSRRYCFREKRFREKTALLCRLPVN